MRAGRERGGALVVMAKAPEKESVMTRLKGCLSDEQRVRLYGNLLASTVYQFGNVPGVDTLVAYWPPSSSSYFRRFGLEVFPQSEGDIGVKMHGVVREALARGYGKAVVVGVDIPGLTRAIVLDAFGLLEQRDIVFGPATDGGYYLVGMKAAHGEVFEGVHWSSEETLRQSMERASALGLSVALLETLDDIDTEEDLKKHPHLMG